ncbi:MAG: hypothetical protein ACE5HV_14840 [Acidobacteriota bacterium]
MTLGICLLVPACASLSDISSTGPTVFGPSETKVRALLALDRVQEALQVAGDLAEEFAGPGSDVVLGQALLRNGELIEAEARFRRGADAGIGEGYLGLAVESASSGDWQSAATLARRALEDPQLESRGHSLLASAAWRRGEREAMVAELAAWSQSEPVQRRAAVASAMAAAAADLTGEPLGWRGDPSLLEVTSLPRGGYVVVAQVANIEAHLLFDLSARQSSISSGLATAAGLKVESGLASVAQDKRAGTDTPAASLSARQAACPSLALGKSRLQNIIVAVDEPPPGADGILAMDLLSTARWSFRADGPALALGPAVSGRAVERLVTGPDRTVIAWLEAKLIYQGLALQLLLYPRVLGELIPAMIDLAGSSRLEAMRPGMVLGADPVIVPVRLGGWSGEVRWVPADLEGRATGGGVAPAAMLGNNLLGGWTLHWLPDQQQLRLEAPQAP